MSYQRTVRSSCRAAYPVCARARFRQGASVPGLACARRCSFLPVRACCARRRYADLWCSGPTLPCSESGFGFSGRLIRANVFPRSVCAEGVYLKFGERKGVCPLGRVFCIGRICERLCLNSNALRCSALQTYATRRPCETGGLMNAQP
jgi:hypothetical protein